MTRASGGVRSRLLAGALGLAGLAGPGASPGRAAEVDCLIQPWRAVTLSAAIEGVVEEMYVERGDLVEQGQVLARLESSVEQASIEVARARAEARGQIESSAARLAYTTRFLERQQNLEEREIVSRSAMDEAESSQRVAEAEMRAARESRDEAVLEVKRNQAILDRRSIRSPVTGVVVKRILSPGEYADPPQLLELAQIDPLRVEVFAPLGLFGKIEIGMLGSVLPEAPVGGEYEAKVIVVDRVIDAASGTFGVRLELPNPGNALPAGLNCRVRFPVDASPDLADTDEQAPAGSR